MTWGYDRDFVPWGKRDKDIKPRIYDHLTEPARKRITRILENVTYYDDICKTYSEFRTEIVDIPEYFSTKNRTTAYSSQSKLIEEEETDQVLVYLEILLNVMWSNKSHNEEELWKMDHKIRRVLHESQVLFRIVPEHKYLHRSYVEGDVRKTRPRRYDPDRDGHLHFEKLADETIIQADQDLRVLSKEAKWKEPLSGYNAAWDAYQDGNFSAIIAEKLYNSVEAVLQQMCVEQGWENEDQTVGTYLDRLNQEGLFEMNQSLVGEWQQIMGGIRTGIQKTGDRKNWHDEVNQDYCLLLLHQTSAFLTFVISQYEKKFS